MDLSKNIGLPISLNGDGTLLFREPLAPVNPSHRTLDDLRPYLADPTAEFIQPIIEPQTIDQTGRQDQQPKTSVYDMYRGICLPNDCVNFKNAGIRFDITVFHPGRLGEEFCKTAGHFHPFKQGTQVRYPETYEVISGKALFLMQKMDDTFSEVLDVCVIEVSESEDVIFLPGYAHFLINPTNDTLITSNWSADNFESLYEPVAKYHGAAYYVIKGANDKPKFIKNPNYKNVPEIKFLKPKELPQFGLINGQPAYTTGQKSPDMLRFINRPELYLEQLTIKNCYI